MLILFVYCSAFLYIEVTADASEAFDNYDVEDQEVASLNLTLDTTEKIMDSICHIFCHPTIGDNGLHNVSR